MTDHNLISAEEAHALLKDTTPGPWTTYVGGFRAIDSIGPIEPGVEGGLDVSGDDAELAAASPDLAHTVIAQEEQIERLQNAVNLMTHTSRLYLLEDLYEDQVLTTQDMEKNND